MCNAIADYLPLSTFTQLLHVIFHVLCATTTTQYRVYNTQYTGMSAINLVMMMIMMMMMMTMMMIGGDCEEDGGGRQQKRKSCMETSWSVANALLEA